MFNISGATGGAQQYTRSKGNLKVAEATLNELTAENKSAFLRDHLTLLEAESIHIFREVAAEFERPTLLFSGGKDSICLLRLAEKAFRPGAFPFPLVHVDTGHNFPEVISFRDQIVQRLRERLIVASVQDGINSGLLRESPGEPSRNRLQSPTLLSIIETHKFDAAIGGARRDEEKARAKERIFSFRDSFGQWDPKHQRPELWNIYNARIHPGEHMRVFPLSNWTEADVWQYIDREQLAVPSLYFAHDREVVERDGQLLPVNAYLPLKQAEQSRICRVRMRTVGDMTCTGCHESDATTVDDIIREIATMQITERGSRTDDKRSETAMEDRKREGYF
jgi:sulfate adenylyltransferase subunit 2